MYYSPVLGRPLTIQGPITSAGGFGAGPGAMVGGALPGSSGLSLGAMEARQAEYVGAGEAAGFALGSLIGGTEAGSTYGPEGAFIGGVLGALAGLFEDLLGGGGPSEPWWWIREATRVGGSPQTWAPIYGMPAAYPPNQGKSAPAAAATAAEPTAAGRLWFVAAGDKTYGLPSDFWRWYHRQVKGPGDQDLSKGEAQSWYEIWLQEGRPDAEGHRTTGSGSKFAPLPVPETIPPPVGPLEDPIPVFEF